MTSYREKNSIRSIIEEFFATGVVDEVMVVDNNAEEGSVAEVKKTGARLIFEKKQGHGFALRRGMTEARGDYVILCEADGSFDPRDVEKFLAYAPSFPVVLGTRTNTSLIQPDSAMFFLRRLADIFEGRLIELLFMSSTITDVGCTYRLFHRDIIQMLSGVWLTGDSHFVTETTLQIAARKIPFIEIPVAFRKRVGESFMTGNLFKIAKWGVKLLIFIIVFRLRWIFKRS